MDLALTLFVQSTGGLIKQQDRWLTDHSSCNSNSLLLTARQPVASDATLDVVALVQLVLTFLSVRSRVDQIVYLLPLAFFLGFFLKLLEGLESLIVLVLTKLLNKLGLVLCRLPV